MTLINGFTTVQSAGAMADKDLGTQSTAASCPVRASSSLGSANERTGDAAALRAPSSSKPQEPTSSRFGSKSIRDSGAPAVARAVEPRAARRKLGDCAPSFTPERRGCHHRCQGRLHQSSMAVVNDEALKLMAERVYFDQHRPVLQNYIENKQRFGHRQLHR